MARGRALAILAVALLFVATLASKALLRERRFGSEVGANDAADALAYFSPSERLAASLLGGTRAIFLNVLWMRIQILEERGRFLELPLLLKAVEDMQGVSPYLYEMQARMMCLDIPSAVRDAEERWRWILRGLELMERGLLKFPRSTELLDQSGYVYYARFHSQRNRDDRARYMREFGKDPLLVSQELLARAIAMPDHPIEADTNYWALQMLRLQDALGVRPSGQEGADEVAALLERARERLRDPELRARVEAIWTRAARHIEHFERDHRAQYEGRALRIFEHVLRGWKFQLQEFRRRILGDAAAPSLQKEG